MPRIPPAVTSVDEDDVGTELPFRSSGPPPPPESSAVLPKPIGGRAVAQEEVSTFGHASGKIVDPASHHPVSGHHAPVSGHHAAPMSGAGHRPLYAFSGSPPPALGAPPVISGGAPVVRHAGSTGSSRPWTMVIWGLVLVSVAAVCFLLGQRWGNARDTTAPEINAPKSAPS